MESRESEGRIVAATLGDTGNAAAPRTRPSEGGPWRYELSVGHRTRALTLDILSP